MTNLGLDGAIRVIAECVEKRVDLGDFEETAWDVALDMFEFFLENPERADAKSVMDYGVSPSDFAIWMAQTAMPLIGAPPAKEPKSQLTQMPAKHGETDLFFQIWSVEDPDANQTSVGYLIVLAVLLLDSSPASAAAWSVAFNVPASAARQFVIRRFFNGVEE